MGADTPRRRCLVSEGGVLLCVCPRSAPTPMGAACSPDRMDADAAPSTGDIAFPDMMDDALDH